MQAKIKNLLWVIGPIHILDFQNNSTIKVKRCKAPPSPSSFWKREIADNITTVLFTEEPRWQI